ncbi:nucleotidyltransferase family protein [Clostridium sp. Marseille-P2415]|uniref:nucleotidyltransferase family protein n=1 Tax=Clostridium sp. Marseille-P2415 TaxID=1805471 RepID=UPI00098850F1|nr:sugar phosphate nucleotidyltransferase [Clostridium sp. Marseille-P2415]
MRDTAVVIMAAGIGSRFGNGIKQLEPVGPNGEIIMDYSIFDALEAGFNRIVFIIRKSIEEEFKKVIGKRIEKLAPVEYVFQELEDLPEGFILPEGRVKPWGTGQAVLACKGIIKEPFVVINADDYYGKEAFVKIHNYLVTQEETSPYSFCMAGFMLGNTLSPNGEVTRGVCSVDETGKLSSVTETFHIKHQADGTVKGEDEYGKQIILSGDNLVSMNMWGVTPGFFKDLEAGFVSFLEHLKEDEKKKEYLLPVMIDDLIKRGKAKVAVLKTNDKWFGVTYQEDKEEVKKQISHLIEEGKYSKNLFEEFMN